MVIIMSIIVNYQYIMKTCRKCNEEKDITLFVKNESLCKECNNKMRREKYAKDSEYADKIKTKQRNTNIKIGSKLFKDKQSDDTKHCKYCDESKNVSLFRPNRAKCIDCERKDGRDYRKSDIGKTKSIEWVDQNREQMSKLQSKWHQENKTKINAKYTERIKTDPIFKMHVTAKSRIRSALKKSKKTDDYLGCDGEFYVKWMEFCLEYETDEDMTLENHGKIWHVDHVIPVNTFNLEDEEQQNICFNWRNTMPLRIEKNLSKHDKIIPEQIKTHYKHLLKFHKDNNSELPKEFQNLYAKHLTMTGIPLEPKATTNK